jgi:RHS repeat-associated protein
MDQTYSDRVTDAYGQRAASSVEARSGFAGEVTDAMLPWYLLDDRFYVPSLRSFISPDRASPFDRGGLNRYAYCGGDPVNRVDPDGEAWWEWLAAGLGLAAAIVGTVATGGALAGFVAAAASSTLGAAMTTASGLTLAAAALDVVSIVAEVGSLASLAAGDEKAAGIFGWVAFATGAAATGAAWRAAKAGRPRGAYDVPIIDAQSARPGKLRFSSDGRLKFRTHWVRRKDPIDPLVTHWGVDSVLTGKKLKPFLRRIGKRPVVGDNNRVYLYSGVDGRPNGQQWADGRRLPEVSNHLFYLDDLASTRKWSKALPGRELSVEDIGGITFDDMIDKISRPGHHIHAYCYSAVDSFMLDVLNAQPVPVYKL